jgi:hypothetical protein
VGFHVQYYYILIKLEFSRQTYKHFPRNPFFGNKLLNYDGQTEGWVETMTLKFGFHKFAHNFDNGLKYTEGFPNSFLSYRQHWCQDKTHTHAVQ